MEVLDLFKKHWVSLLKVFKNIFKKLRIILDQILVISESRFTIDYIIVLLDIELIIILLIIIVLIMDFSFDYESHVTEWHTDVISKI
jgi:hypothetical protein